MTIVYLTATEILGIAEFLKEHLNEEVFEIHQEFLPGAGLATEITCDGYKKDITLIYMTETEKELIYKDACCRLLYHPYGAYTLEDGTIVKIQLTGADDGQYYGYILDTWGHIPDRDVKLYLRPMSSMTDEELKDLQKYSGLEYDQLFVNKHGNNSWLDFYLEEIPAEVLVLVFDWLNSHHFDYRHLIEQGLAFVAQEEMYVINKL